MARRFIVERSRFELGVGYHWVVRDRVTGREEGRFPFPAQNPTASWETYAKAESLCDSLERQGVAA